MGYKNHKNKNDHRDVYYSSNQRYKTIPIQTDYIRPGKSYEVIIHEAGKYLEDGDYLVISETPIAISQGRLVDEAMLEPSMLSFFLAECWSKYLWGYILGPLFRIKKRTIKNLRNLPREARSHKKLILDYYGLKHALKPASEAGVDLSNVPGTFVCLLPEDPQGVVDDITEKISYHLKKDVKTMIIDTDVTYELLRIKFTSIPIAVSGIRKDLGIFAYIFGRFGRIRGPTPLAVSGCYDIEKSIEIARVAEECQDKIDFKMETVYDMDNMFKGGITNITVEMLASIPHTPAVIVRTI